MGSLPGNWPCAIATNVPTAKPAAEDWMKPVTFLCCRTSRGSAPAMKAVAALRNQFGGHAVKKAE